MNQRKERNESVVSQSFFLQVLDYNLNQNLLKEWKSHVEAKYKHERKDIQVSFNILELASDVIQPSVKLEIRVRASVMT